MKKNEDVKLLRAAIKKSPKRQLTYEENLLLREEICNNPNEYFTTNEVAKVLGVDPETVRRWARLKKIPYSIVTTHIVYLIQGATIAKLLPRYPIFDDFTSYKVFN